MVGISHRTATVALREQAALTEPAARALLGDLRSTPWTSAAAVLSTCNRTEVYALSSAPDPIEPLRGALAARGRLGPETVAAAGFHHTGPDALRHLFRVAAGLDSMVVGEPEIQHQVRRAAAVAAEEGMLGDGLDAVFRAALAAGRRVRRETGVGRGAVSTASVCVALVRQALGEIAGRRALVVGAGAMASSAARALARNGAGEIVVANRTAAAARRLAQDVGGTGVGLGGLEGELAPADLVVSCTVRARAGAPPRRRRPRGPRPGTGARSSASTSRCRGTSSPSWRASTGVVLLDIDDLRLTAEANRAGRAVEARRGEAIVAARGRALPAAPASRPRRPAPRERRLRPLPCACRPCVAAPVQCPAMGMLDAVADPVRLRVVRHLARHDSATLAELADAAGVHVNTIRGHVASLEDAEVLASTQKPATGPGRPPTEYRLADGWGLSSTDFLELAGLLAAALVRSRPDPSRCARRAPTGAATSSAARAGTTSRRRSRWRSSGSGSTPTSTARPFGSPAARARPSPPITPRSCAPWRPASSTASSPRAAATLRVAEHDANPEARRCTLRLTRSPG